ncbi:universal stress protein [Lacisediminihabitans changchengi]|uniref:Universal stress protein n=1 Tax=Lacisediminihabitans changchengi TaxID=2787634 RepID=A0A934W2M0_9MICO|nr:universal stress protein [Lacisediminihabitans changchengi]MBK4346966.1 universal stress protein [Lacisediminihabitans changchengi]MBK4347911.1 universal stress protein [Lacisediminihabitans changchengi]
MAKSIVVGIDGSSAGDAAITWAATRAARQNRPLQILHVIDDDWGAIGTRQLAELHPEALELVAGAAALASSVAPEVECVVRVTIGDPIVELVDASHSAHLVVVGTHKTGFFHGRALGSRSLQLAAASQSPVAIIPGFSTSQRDGIVVGLDDSAGGEAALAFAARESRELDEPLVILHAIAPPRRRQSAIVTAMTSSASSLPVHAIERVKALGVSHHVRVRSVRRPPAEALIDAAAHAELLVLGSTRRRGADLTLLGPVVHDVLMNITGPTVVVHGLTSVQRGSLVPGHTALLVDAEGTTESPDRSEW